MERESSIIKQEANTRENGSTTRSMVMESSSMAMETATKEPGEMDSDLITEYTNIQMEMFMMESGGMTAKKVKGSLIWPPETNTKEIGNQERKMAKVAIFLFRSLCFCQR